MKTLIYSLLLSLIFVYSCSNNPVSNNSNTNTNDSLIFAKDSLVAYSDSAFLNYYIEIDSLKSTKYKIVFTGITTDASQNSFVAYNFQYYQDSVHIVYQKVYYGNAINQSFSDIVNLPSGHVLVCILDCWWNNPVPHQIIRLKNIKFYKVY